MYSTFVTDFAQEHTLTKKSYIMQILIQQLPNIRKNWNVRGTERSYFLHFHEL